MPSVPPPRPPGLRPVNMPPPTADFHPTVDYLPGEVMEIEGYSDEELERIRADLEKLRVPFPDSEVEKLPRATRKGAWNDLKSQSCNTCGGYHPNTSVIHLDYVGHAKVTRRLLEVDPFWEWDFLATTENGLPVYSDGGLWITLTVCGVTRKGFGDGSSVKEIIGDAIRNAAMRFGVALEQWMKEKPYDATAEADRRTSSRRERPVGQSTHREGVGRQSGRAADAPQRAANQDALDSLLDVCNQEGLDRRAVEDRFNRFNPDRHLTQAASEDILAYAAVLLAEATAEPDGPDGDSGTEGADRADAPDGEAAGESDPGHAGGSQSDSDGSTDAAGDDASGVPAEGDSGSGDDADAGGPEAGGQVAPADLF